MEKTMKKRILTFIFLSASAVNLQGVYKLTPSKPVMMYNNGRRITTTPIRELNNITRPVKVRITYKSGEERYIQLSELPGLNRVGGNSEEIYKTIRDKNGNMIRKLVRENYTPKAMYLELGNQVLVPIFEWKDNRKTNKWRKQ